MKITIKLITTIITLLIITSHIANGQDNIFTGTSSTDWDNAANWSTGKVPPSDIVQKITISADCEVTNSTDYTFYEGSTFNIASGVTFTNNGTGTWTIEGLMYNVGTYVGDLVIAGNIEPGDNATTWSCGDALVYGGQSYATVQIGGQCWIAENINVGTEIIGTSNQTDNNIIEKYCYGNTSTNCDTYGGLYQWDEMMQYVTTESTQGVCPTGWHIPTDIDWTTLTDYLGGTSVAGGKMKETGTTHWSSPNTGATNSSDFTALPGGDRYTNGSFSTQGDDAYLWSSTEDGSDAWYRLLYYGNAQVFRFSDGKTYGFSVRCVRD